MGPTLDAGKVRDLVSAATVRPPIAHGDLFRLGLRRGTVVVIVDGYYHHRPPVRHKEILAALAAGVNVVGCSSMGALRAAELHPYGMIGNGLVFEMYRDGLIEADEEVAVAHGEPPEYRRFSEPLVNIRVALAEAERAAILTAEEASTILSHAATLTYSRRTWYAIEERLRFDNPAAVAAFNRLRSHLANNPTQADRKAADAIDTLRRLDALISTANLDALPWMTPSDWRNRYLYEWHALFDGAGFRDGEVGYGAILKYQQLYHDDFTRRWRTFALSQIADGRPATSAPGHDSVEDRALDNASRLGTGMRPLTPPQAEEWLTERESVELTPREATLRVLIRSYRPSRGMYDLVEAFPELARDPQARRAVQESIVVNMEVASWQPGQAVEHIRESVVLNHLAKKWSLSPTDSRALRAHARDRGFAWLENAIEAARQFYLREHLLSSGEGPNGKRLIGLG